MENPRHGPILIYCILCPLVSVLWTANITLPLRHYKGNIEGGLVRNVCMGTI